MQPRVHRTRCSRRSFLADRNHRVWQVLGTDGSSELSTDLRGWDTDGSGAIGFEEFKQLMKAAVPPPPEESLAAESF